MRIVVFGLTISSAWGNGHATLLRGLFRALNAAGHKIDFFERDVDYYAAHRDATAFPFANLHLYRKWEEVLPQAAESLRIADAAIATSYCPDGAAACRLMLESRASLRTVFYDMDTPVTLTRLLNNEQIAYLPASGLGGFDLVLSYTGGVAIDHLRTHLRARRVETLYGWVDPQHYFPVAPVSAFEADFSYLGTYAADRQAAVRDFLLEPARRLLAKRFVIGGAMYPNAADWPPNVRHFEHVAPPEHAAFYSSSPLTLNVTRRSMAEMGFCPSGRLFEAAACGTAVLSDCWDGLDTFFEIGEEILIAESTAGVEAELRRDPEEIRKLGARARERALDCHTAGIRAQRLVRLLEDLPAKPIEDSSIALAGR